MEVAATVGDKIGSLAFRRTRGKCLSYGASSMW